MKNVAYFESFYSNEIEQLAETVPDHRLNNFYLFNKLVDDLEKDRKSHCEVGIYPRSQRRSPFEYTCPYSFPTPEIQPRADCVPSQDPGISVLSTTGGCLHGEVTRYGEMYRSVQFGTQRRFEPSSLFSSSDIINTVFDRQLCPHTDSDGNMSENLGRRLDIRICII